MKILITLDEFKAIHKKDEDLVLSSTFKYSSLEEVYDKLTESNAITMFRQKVNSAGISVTLRKKLDFANPFDFIKFIVKHNPMLSEEEIYDMDTDRCPILLMARELPTYIDLVIRTVEMSRTVKEETLWDT